MKSYDQTTMQMAMYLSVCKLLKETAENQIHVVRNQDDVLFQVGLLRESLGHYQNYVESLEKRIKVLENANS